MSYKVYAAPIKNLKKHPNADRLQIGEVLGNLVIVGLDTQDGELGLFFSFGLMEGYIKEQPDFIDIEEEEQTGGEVA